MDSNSKNIFNLYKKVLNEAAGADVPFEKPMMAMKKQTASPKGIQQQASQLKGQVGQLAQQALEPDVSSDDIVKQAQPLVAAANSELKAAGQIKQDPTSLVDIPRFGDSDLVSWTTKEMETEFPEMSIRQVEEQAEAAYDLKESFLLIGDPGVGKSSIFKQVGKRVSDQKNKEFVEWFDLGEEERDNIIADPSQYFVYVDIRLADQSRDEIIGVPLRTDKPYTVYSPPSWAKLFTTPGADGFLFLDEFNQGLKEVKDAAFKIVLDRVLGDRRMAKDVGVVAACNMGQMFGNEAISPANINRFGAGVLIVSPDEWREYAVSVGIDDAIIAFTKAIPENALYKEPNGENPFVTPRVLEKISKGIEHFRKKYDEYTAMGRPYNAMEQIRLFAAQRAGVPWANRFDTFLKHIQSFDMGKILKDPKKYLKDQPLDKMLALIVFVSNKLRIASQNAKSNPENVTPEDREVMIGLAKIMTHLSPEAVCVMFETLNKDMPRDLITFLLDFVVYEEFEPAVKKEFLGEVLPRIKKIIAGGSCSAK